MRVEGTIGRPRTLSVYQSNILVGQLGESDVGSSRTKVESGAADI